ncbi:DNA-binding MarR family transcriptional regulator [Friedmanniella endophytica]|uniref:DNA-binding MarR family transcriptional regulator n=1 Tax=Microlunatus kandeliicorticis TaxID=1759536 RepID=A0A7W3P603_9ACTN|nr:MarR family transcriptional regulator [Microlunatus kandeliicorticis]MBA8794551.1 DNA-binding MarR family transcriptional regulator [Microlunatus kandeliicorticis]
MQLSGWQPRTPEEGLIAALIRVGRMFKSAGREADPHTYWLLHMLRCRGTVRMTDLAADLQLDTSTVSRQLSQLDKAGLIVRSQHPDDGRAQAVSISPAGTELLDRAQEERVRFVTERTADWAPGDLATLTRLLLAFAGEDAGREETPHTTEPRDRSAGRTPTDARTHELEHA